MSDYRTIFETLLPDGSVWKPKYIETLGPGIELITNGTFDTDIDGWITSSTPGEGFVQWFGGDNSMQFFLGE